MTSAGAVAVPPAPPSRPVLDAARPHPVPGVAYASWTRRVVAALLDHSLLAGVTWLALRDTAAPPSLAPALFQGEVPDPATPWWHSLWVVATVVVVLGLQADTGWTPGKLVAGIAVVRERDLRPAGFVRTLLRLAAHLVDAVLLIGYLRPLWESKRRTFADSMLETVVVRRRPERLRPGWELALTMAALLACLAGLGLQTTWASAGGSRLVAEGACVPVAEAGHDALEERPLVTVQADQTWGWEQRLWVRDDQDETMRYTVTWPVPGDLLPLDPSESSEDEPGEMLIETTVTPLGGGEPVHGSQPVRPWEASDDVAQVDLSSGDPMVTAVLEVARPPAEPPVRVTTRVTLDGEPVATCTVPRLDPEF